MLRNIILIAALALACAFASGTRADEAIRIDATSDATAQQSFEQMLLQADDSRQQELQMAMLTLNLDGHSAWDVVETAELQSLSIAGIKNRVAGMTAEEIIALAASPSADR